MGSLNRSLDVEIRRIASHRPERLAFLSEAQAASFGVPGPVRLIPPGLDLARYRYNAHPGRDCCWLGRITPEKGLDDVFAFAARTGHAVTVFGVMQNPAYWDGLARRYPGVPVTYGGFLDMPALAEAVREYRALLMTPKWLEAFGIVGIEALACGTPVVSTDCPTGPAEILAQGDHGRLVPVGDADALGAALLATLARWALLCFGLGLAINAVGQWQTRRAQGAVAAGNLGRGTWLALVLVAVLFLAFYGDVALGRVVTLESPVESRSLWERDRDARIALRLVEENPLLGVGLEQYLPAARRYDAWAEIVHNVPLWLAAELGLGAALLWLWLLLGPVARRGALGVFAPQTALWLGFWLMGVLQTAPHPLNDLRSALLTGLVAALMTLPPANLPDTSGSCTIAGWVS